jgi:hypothetical protein
MIPLEYSRAEMRQLQDLLVSPHSIKIRVRLLNQDHDYLDDLSDFFVGGQINFDMDGDVDRSLDLDLADPSGRIHIDTNSPAEGTIWADRMISVVYVIANPTRTQIFSIPVFCGPISTSSRDGFYLKVKCLGKETLGLDNLFHGKTYKKGHARTTVIRSLLSDVMGEIPGKISVPDRTARLPRNLSIGPEDKPWLVAQRLAGSMQCELFYDGRGVVRMRKRPRASIYTWGMNALCSIPIVGFDLEGMYNVVVATGSKPKGMKNRVKYIAVAPKNHPLSPYNIGRRAKARFIPLFIQDDTMKTIAEVRQVAKDALEHGLLAAVDVTFDGVPNPLLELGDINRVHHEDWSGRFRLRQFTLPLLAGEAMSVGYTKSIKPKGEKHKRPKRWRPPVVSHHIKLKRKKKKHGTRKGR